MLRQARRARAHHTRHRPAGVAHVLAFGAALAVTLGAGMLGAGMWVARSDSPAAHTIVGTVRQRPVLRTGAHSVRAALVAVLGPTVGVGFIPGAVPDELADAGTGASGVSGPLVAIAGTGQPLAGTGGGSGLPVLAGRSPAPPRVSASVSTSAPAPEVAAATPPSSGPPSSAVVPVVPGPRAELPSVRQQYQTMNNCGPAAAAMALGFYGHLVSQEAARVALRPGGYDDKNVTAEEIAAYLAGFGLETRVRVAGSKELLRTLVANNVPVLVHQLLAPDADKNDIGHYAVVRGYDEAGGVLLTQDPYFGAGRRLAYAEFDRLWRPFGRRYLPVYPPEAAPLVQAILGEDWDEQTNWSRAQRVAENEINRAPDDAYAWFNLGDGHLAQGDAETAVHAYERALALGLPRRHMWYQIGPIVAHNQVGNHTRALVLAQRALTTESTLAEVQYERGVALLGLGQGAAALEAFRLAARYGPNLAPAHEMVAQLAAR